MTGFSGWSAGGTNWFQDDKTWQGSAQISWTRGAHNLMAGAELRKLTTGREAGNSPRGTFTFNNSYTGYAPTSFVLGIPQTLITPLRQVRGVVAEWRDGFFVLDNWQVSRKLTLNYGLRYELPTVPYSVNGYHTLLNAEQTAVRPTNPPQPGLEFIAPNHKNFAPRIGFAYRLTEQDRVPRRLRHLLQSEPDQQLYLPERESALRHCHNLHVRSGKAHALARQSYSQRRAKPHADPQLHHRQVAPPHRLHEPMELWHWP